jgi:hypothetical protein
VAYTISHCLELGKTKQERRRKAGRIDEKRMSRIARRRSQTKLRMVTSLHFFATLTFAYHADAESKKTNAGSADYSLPDVDESIVEKLTPEV